MNFYYASRERDGFTEYLTLDTMGMPDTTLKLEEALMTTVRQHTILYAQAADEGGPIDDPEWEIHESRPFCWKPDAAAVATAGYNDKGELVSSGSRSSSDPSADLFLMSLALDTQQAIKRGNYHRSLLVLLLERVCGTNNEWSFLLDVLRERCRQIEKENYDNLHDDAHASGELAQAAACYAISNLPGGSQPSLWPWEWDFWKPTTPRRNWEKAAALLLAEGEAFDRRIPTVQAP